MSHGASRRFLAVDLETTGLDPRRDRIIEVGLIRFTPVGVEASYSSLVNPSVSLSYEIEQLTQIRTADLQDAPHFDSLRLDVEAFIGDAAIVGQHVDFDLAFLAQAGIRPPGPVFDTFEIATVLDPQNRDYSLKALAQRYGIAMPVHHRALADAETARQVFLALFAQAQALPPDLLSALRRISGDASWPLAQFLAEVAGEAPRLPPLARARPQPPRARGAAKERARGAVKELPGDQAAAEEPPPAAMAPTLRPVVAPGKSARRPQRTDPVDPEEAVTVLAAGARHSELFGLFEQRPEQVAMTRAVAAALAAGRRLVIEAGTGTGKSIAYLIPAALSALRQGSRVLVSTNTIALQEQLLQKDVPALRVLLRDALGDDIADTLRVEPLKGRRNYLCLRRVVQESQSVANQADARLLARLLLWLRATDTGDRAELRILPDEEPAWTRLSAEGEDCLSGGHCPFVRDGTCFLLRARQRAEAADILIVNHALLLSDLAADGAVLPPADTVIIDEAHHLESVATQHLGATITPTTFIDLFDRLLRSGPGNRLAGLLPLARAALRPPEKSDERAALLTRLTREIDNARHDLSLLFDGLRAFVAGQAEDNFGPEQRLRITSGRRAQPAWSEIEIRWQALALRLQAIAASLDQVASALQQLPPRTDLDVEGLVEEFATLQRALGDLATAAERLLTHHDPAQIVWLTASDRSGAMLLNAAPLAVADALRESLFARKRSVVLTGATLAADTRFDYLRQTLGLTETEEVLLGSPFDYRRAVQLLLPTDMLAPSDPGYPAALQEALIDLTLASEGRALVLFTSHGALRATADAVRRPLQDAGIAVLAQGPDGSPARLLAKLTENPRAVLLGTASLWEGVDVPGPAISLVVIARLPFPVPTDPVFAARSELYADPFREYSLPQAIVRFRQGFGRLIRRADDRGVVAVLDGRIASKSYGQAFVRSLPPTTTRRVPLREFAPLTSEWLRA